MQTIMHTMVLAVLSATADIEGLTRLMTNDCIPEAAAARIYHLEHGKAAACKAELDDSATQAGRPQAPCCTCAETNQYHDTVFRLSPDQLPAS